MNLEGYNYTVKEFFQRLKTVPEKFGLIKIEKSDINFYTENVPSFVKDFLGQGIDMNPRPEKKDYNSSKTQDWQRYIESYCKLVWLAKEYLTVGKFRNPMCVHFNQKKQKWEIHPGGSRQCIHYFFGPETETFIGINNGIAATFVKTYENQQEFDLDFKKPHKNYSFVFCKDYNTVIPHVHFETHIIDKNVVKKHQQLKNFYNTVEIIGNFDTAQWNIPSVKNPVGRKKITVTDPTELNIAKALILAPSFYNIEAYGVKIEPA